MSYLARLKAKIAEKLLPDELTKLPKGPSVSFGSSQGEGFCRSVTGEALNAAATRDAIEERKAIIVDCCPTPYVDAFAWLNHQKPATVGAEQ